MERLLVVSVTKP